MNAISFFLTRFPADTDKRTLTNLKIKAWHTSESDFSEAYLSVSDAITIYEGDYTLPGELGEVKFDVDPFVYNGADNLVIEFIWGENSYFVGSDSFKAQCTITDNTSVAYGYQDNTSNPRFVDDSNIRPNTVFYFTVEELAMFNVVFEVINSNYNLIHENAVLTIGSMQLVTNVDGRAYANMAEGSYFVSAEADYSNSFGVDFNLNTENQTVVIDMVGTSINQNYATQGIYPNPANSSFTIQGLQGFSKIEIYNLSGQSVKTKYINSSDQQIDISDLSEGIYIVKVESNNYQSSFKLIVK